MYINRDTKSSIPLYQPYQRILTFILFSRRIKYVHNKYTAGDYRKFSRKSLISILLVLTMGLSTLAGCDSRPKVSAQTTDNAQLTVNAQTIAAQTTAAQTAASETAPKADPPGSAPYFSTYEFDLEDMNICEYLLADPFCAVATMSVSDEYMAALQNTDNPKSKYAVCDEAGNPLYPDCVIQTYSYAGESLSTIDLNAAEPTIDQPCFALTAEEDIAVLSRNYDPQNGDFLVSITVFDSLGELESRIDEIPFEKPISFVYNFCADGNGNYYILGLDCDSEESISVVSADGKLLATYPLGDNYAYTMMPASNGIYIITVSTDNDGNNTTIATFLSDSQGDLDEGIALPAFFNNCRNIFLKGDFIYGSDAFSLQAFSLKTKTLETVLEWKDADLTFLPCLLSINSDGAIAAIGYGPGGNISTAAYLTPSSTDPNAGKTEIVVAGLEISTDVTVLTAVKYFNQSHSDCRIVLRDYAEDFVFDDEDYRKDLAELNQKMRMEVYSGDAPDVWIDRESDALGLTAFASDACLVDLYPYIKNDPDIKADDYFKNVLFGYDTNGKLYRIPSGFFTRCFYGNPSVIGTDSSWTVSDYYALSEKLGPEKKILTDIPKKDLLEWTLETQMDSLLDLNSGRVSFDSDYFLEFLKWADDYGTDAENYVTAPNDVMKNQLAIDLTWIESPQGFYSNYSLLKFMPTYLGYPGSNGDGLSFSSAYVCGITAGCEDPDLAWDFVRLFLLDDIQNNIGGGFIPVSRNAAAKQIENNVEYMEGDGIDASTLDAVFWNSYYDVLEKVNVPSGANYEVSCIVLEESAAFFAGQKTAEETAALIQNRVQIYVDDQMN